MRRLIWLVVLVVLAGIFLSANILTERILAERLPEAFATATGQPATIRGLRANIWMLRAYADEILIGEVDTPSQQLTNVMVAIDGTELLSGMIHLSTATAEKFRIWPERWQAGASDSDAGGDYSGAERWIPDVIDIDDFELWGEDTREYSATDMRWRVIDGEARQISWTESRTGADLRVRLKFESMYQFLAQSGGNVSVSVISPKRQQPLLAATLTNTPSANGFSNEVNIEADGAKGTLRFETGRLFELPATSTLEFMTVSATQLEATTDLISDGNPAARDLLHSPLPVLDLPDHVMQLSVKAFGVDDEVIRDLRAQVSFTSASDEAASRISITKLAAQLPRADLEGELEVSLGETWQARISARIANGGRPKSTPEFFRNTDWRWHSGRADMVTAGATVAELLEHASGDANLQGEHHGRKILPVTLAAKLIESKGRVGADVVELTLGDSKIKGTVWIEESNENLLVRLESDLLDLEQFFDDDPRLASDLPGVEVPDLERWTSDTRVDAKFVSAEVRLPGLVAKKVDLAFQRRREGDQLKLEFFPDGEAGRVSLDIDTKREATANAIALNVALDAIGHDHLRLTTAPADISGSLQLTGAGDNFRSLVRSLAGTGSVRFDFADKGTVSVAATPVLVYADERITGVELREMSLNLFEFKANGTATLSRIAPAVTADLQADSIDLDRVLAAFMPGSTELGLAADTSAGADPGATPEAAPGSSELSDQKGADDATPSPADTAAAAASTDRPTAQANLDVVKAAEKLEGEAVEPLSLPPWPNTQLALEAASVALMGEHLGDFSVALDTQPGRLLVSRLHMTTDMGRLDASGRVEEKDTEIGFDLKATVADVIVAPLVNKNLPHVSRPLSGSIELNSSGADMSALVANLRGHILLQGHEDQSAADNSPLNVDVELQAVDRGVQIDVTKFRWGSSNLEGKIVYQRTQPVRLVADVKSDYLDITAWENLGAESGDAAVPEGSLLGRLSTVTRDWAGTLAGILGAPGRIFDGGGRDRTGKTYFDTEPLDLAPFRDLDANVKLDFKELHSELGAAMDIAVSFQASQGVLQMTANSANVNSAPAKAHFYLDASQDPAVAKLTTTMEDYFPEGNPKMAPRSGFIDLSATGNSEAQLAASLNGEVYMEVGSGQADFASVGLGFFTSDLLSRVRGMLLPEPERVPRMDCAVAFLRAEDGKIETPFAMVLQTRQANVLVRTTIDLKKEQLVAQFDSRSRRGAGLAVGNVFSNTVRLRGSLSNPRLVPNATGLLWRGWAAVATGGLSLLGESFFKRVLGARDPCTGLRKKIQEQICGKDTPAARSSLVCPSE